MECSWCWRSFNYGAPPNESESGLMQSSMESEDNALIDFDEVEKLAIDNKPKLIIAGDQLIQELLTSKNLETLQIKSVHYPS